MKCCYVWKSDVWGSNICAPIWVKTFCLTHKAPAACEWKLQTLHLHTENIFPPQSRLFPPPPPFFPISVCLHLILPLFSSSEHLPFLSFPLSSQSSLPSSFTPLPPSPSTTPSSCFGPVSSHCNWQLCFSPLLWWWQRGPVPSRRLCYRLSHEADTLGRPSVICCDNSDYFHSLPSDQHIQFN